MSIFFPATTSALSKAPASGMSRKGSSSIIAPQIWREVSRGGFDALVVHGHTPAAALIAVAAARWAGLPVFARGETHLGLRRSLLKRLVRKPLMSAFYRSLSGVLAIGSANAAFYRAIGVPEERIFSMPYTVDNARFANDSQLSDEQRTKVRAELGVADDDPIVLYAAKLQARKHPDDLLRAAARLKDRGVRFHVVMVGSGEMAAELVRSGYSPRTRKCAFPWLRKPKRPAANLWRCRRVRAAL